MLYLQTHDNDPIPLENLVPLSALQAMYNGPIGNTRGVDDLLETKFAINESSEYPKVRDTKYWQEFENMMKVKAALSRLHTKLEKKGYTESYAECMEVIKFDTLC